MAGQNDLFNHIVRVQVPDTVSDAVCQFMSYEVDYCLGPK